MNKGENIFPRHDMEAVIGHLLRTGVILAAAVVSLGGIVYLFRHGLSPIHYAVFERVTAELCGVRGIVKSAFSFHAEGLIQLGLLFLIATPLARVAFSIVAFARQRDIFYAAVTLFVFGILLYSLLGR
jgi:uncharacterized membrane protein